MDKEQLIKELCELKEKDIPPYRDCEEDHKVADTLLLLFINDADVTKAFNEICKWYI